MRIYYTAEAEGLRHHVRSALGVDAGVWNRLNRRIHDWRRSLESRYGIPADLGLRPDELASVHQSCACGCHSQHAPRQGAEVIGEGLRLIEDFAAGTGGVGVTNICLDKDDIPAYRRVSLDRLFNRVNATAAQAGGYAFVIFGQEPEEMVTGLYHRLRNYNPVPHAPRGLRRRLANPQRPHRENHWRPGFPGPRRRPPAPGGRPRGPRPALAGGVAR